MGLDVVDLIMEVEDEFEIKIPDDDYADLRTVGNLTDYIVDRLAASGRIDAIEPCLNPRYFCRFRRTVTELFDVERSAVRVPAALDVLIPLENRTVNWKRLAEALRVDLPPLVRPDWMSRALLGGEVAAVVAFLAHLHVLRPQDSGTVIGLAVIYAMTAAALTFIAGALTRSSAVHIPHYFTVGSLVPLMILTDDSLAGTRRQAWTRTSVYAKVREIVSVQLGIPIEMVVHNASFVDDLGAD